MFSKIQATAGALIALQCNASEAVYYPPQHSHGYAPQPAYGYAAPAHGHGYAAPVVAVQHSHRTTQQGMTAPIAKPAYAPPRPSH